MSFWKQLKLIREVEGKTLHAVDAKGRVTQINAVVKARDFLCNSKCHKSSSVCNKKDFNHTIK